MSKQIITVSREFGSGGRTVGKRVAELLGVPYYDKELVKQVAVATALTEKLWSSRGRRFSRKNLFSYAFAGMGSRHPMNGLSADDFLWVIQCKVILDLADKGPCVIVGRCADYILQGAGGLPEGLCPRQTYPSGPSASFGSTASRRWNRRSAWRPRTSAAGPITSTIPAGTGVPTPTTTWR